MLETERSHRADELKTGIDVRGEADFRSGSVRNRTAKDLDSETPVSTPSLILVDVRRKEASLGRESIRLLEDMRPVGLLNLLKIEAMDQSPGGRRRLHPSLDRHGHHQPRRRDREKRHDPDQGPESPRGKQQVHASDIGTFRA